MSAFGGKADVLATWSESPLVANSGHSTVEAKAEEKPRARRGLIGTRLPAPGAIYISQTLRFRAPVKIGDTIDAIVEVVDLSEQRQRARLLCKCKVGNTVVLEGEAIVKVPRR